MVEALYTQFQEDLLRFCVSLTGARSAAEDLVQEAFLRALTHLEDLESLSQGQRRAWLYKTARNLQIDRVRKQAREVSGSEEVMALVPFEEDLTQVAVRQMVERLPEEERPLFAMRYFEGYNAAELGEIFGLAPSTVRSRLASARRKLLRWQETEQ